MTEFYWFRSSCCQTELFVSARNVISARMLFSSRNMLDLLSQQRESFVVTCSIRMVAEINGSLLFIVFTANACNAEWFVSFSAMSLVFIHSDEQWFCGQCDVGHFRHDYAIGYAQGCRSSLWVSQHYCEHIWLEGFSESFWLTWQHSQRPLSICRKSFHFKTSIQLLN